MPEPATMIAIMESLRQGSSVLNQALAEDPGKEQAELSREQILIQAIMDALDNKRHNAIKEQTFPLRRELAADHTERVNNPMASPFSRMENLNKPPAYRAEGGGVSTQPGGPAADPEQLRNLAVPPREVFQRMAAKAAEKAGKIRATEYVPKESAINQFNNFSNLRGDYLSADDGMGEALDERQAERVSGADPGTARAPERGRVASGPTENRRGDGWSDDDIAAIRRAQQSDMTDIEILELMRRLKGDGR